MKKVLVIEAHLSKTFSVSEYVLFSVFSTTVFENVNSYWRVKYKKTRIAFTFLYP